MNFRIEKIDSFTGHKDSVFTLSKSNNEHTFYSTGAEGLVVEWDLNHPDIGKPIVQLPNSIYCLFLDSTNNNLIIGNNTQGIHTIDLDRNLESANIKLSKSSFFDIKTYKNNIFIGDSEGIIHVIEKDTFKQKKHIKASEKSVRRLALNVDTQELAAAYSDHTVKIFDINSFELKRVLLGHNNSVFTLKYINKGKTLVSGSRDAHLITWDVQENYKLQKNIAAHNFAINDIIEIEDKNLLVTCSMDKSIKIWESDSLKLLKVIDKARFAGHGTSINRLLWMENKKILLSASDDRTISMWNLF